MCLPFLVFAGEPAKSQGHYAPRPHPDLIHDIFFTCPVAHLITIARLVCVMTPEQFFSGPIVFYGSGCSYGFWACLGGGGSKSRMPLVILELCVFSSHIHYFFRGGGILHYGGILVKRQFLRISGQIIII